MLPSLFRSFKFAATGPVLGSITQDRSTGILGTFGSQAPMVPITLRISSDETPAADLPVPGGSQFDADADPRGPRHRQRPDDRCEKRTGERTLVWKSSIRTPGARTSAGTRSSPGFRPARKRSPRMALLTNYLMANEFHDLTILGSGRRDLALRPAPERARRARRGAEGARASRRGGPRVGRPRRFPRQQPPRRDDSEDPR